VISVLHVILSLMLCCLNTGSVIKKQQKAKKNGSIDYEADYCIATISPALLTGKFSVPLGLDAYPSPVCLTI
jgi:hypothetical protein